MYFSDLGKHGKKVHTRSVLTPISISTRPFLASFFSDLSIRPSCVLRRCHCDPSMYCLTPALP